MIDPLSSRVQVEYSCLKRHKCLESYFPSGNVNPIRPMLKKIYSFLAPSMAALFTLGPSIPCRGDPEKCQNPRSPVKSWCVVLAVSSSPFKLWWTRLSQYLSPNSTHFFPWLERGPTRLSYSRTPPPPSPVLKAPAAPASNPSSPFAASHLGLE